MKLRIKGDSLRIRVGPSEVERLTGCGRIEETIHFAPGVQLTYALELSEGTTSISVVGSPGEVVVLVPTRVAQAWAHGDEVGIYGAFANGSGSLELAIEKDFACLDTSHAGNHDTYPNPKAAC
jgi:hypothetical protein